MCKRKKKKEEEEGSPALKKGADTSIKHLEDYIKKSTERFDYNTSNYKD